MQLHFLDRHLERHLLGNHLLCDAAGLVAAGSSLADERARTIATRALRLLERELSRQTLPDGGYAERTVHYHALVWHDAARACALAAARGIAVAAATRATLARMEQWLATVRRGDGSWPALNDSLPMIEVPVPAAVLSDDIELPDTGWTLVRSGSHELLFEHGDIGPEEQPGHGHSDALSYELVWGERPLVVDTGITTYDVGPTRDYERSARAHATVTVDGDGADELWGSFRVGARGRCVGAMARREGNTRILRGTLTAPAGWRHERTIAFRPGEAMVVHDRVLGGARAGRVVSRVPFHPDVTLDEGEIRCGELRLQLTVLAGGRGVTERGWVGDGFGARRDRAVATFDATPDGVCSYAIAAPDATRSVAELLEMVR
jgi:heparinase II/III-like protein